MLTSNHLIITNKSMYKPGAETLAVTFIKEIINSKNQVHNSLTIKLGFNPINPIYTSKSTTVELRQYYTQSRIINLT